VGTQGEDGLRTRAAPALATPLEAELNEVLDLTGARSHWRRHQWRCRRRERAGYTFDLNVTLHHTIDQQVVDVMVTLGEQPVQAT